MEEMVRTERLVLRRYRIDDAPTINAYITDPRIYRNVGQIPPAQTLEDTKDFLKRSAEAWDAGAGYGLAIVYDDNLIGVVGGGKATDPGAIDFGYWIAPDYWEQGFATEAAGAFRGWLVDTGRAKALTAGYFTDNPGSGKVLSKLGFMLAGHSKYYCKGREEIVDCIDMAWIA